MSNEGQHWKLVGRAKDAGVTVPTREQTLVMDNDAVTAALLSISHGGDPFGAFETVSPAPASRSPRALPTPAPSTTAAVADDRLLSLLERIADALECICERGTERGI